MSEDPVCAICYFKRSEHLPDGACPDREESGFAFDEGGDEEYMQSW